MHVEPPHHLRLVINHRGRMYSAMKPPRRLSENDLRLAAEAAQSLFDWCTTKGWPMPPHRLEVIKAMTGGHPDIPDSGWPAVTFRASCGTEQLYCGFGLRSHRLADIDVTAFDEILIEHGLK